MGDMDLETKLLVPEQTVGLVIGKQGMNLRAIREGYSVRIEVPQGDRLPHLADERLIIVKGPTQSRALAIEHVLRAVQKHTSQSAASAYFKVLVPAARVGHVVGEGGSILRWLSDYFAVQPVLGNEEILGEHLFTVQGAPAAVLEASKQVVALMDVAYQPSSASLESPAESFAAHPSPSTTSHIAYPNTMPPEALAHTLCSQTMPCEVPPTVGISEQMLAAHHNVSILGYTVGQHRIPLDEHPLEANLVGAYSDSTGCVLPQQSMQQEVLLGSTQQESHKPAMQMPQNHSSLISETPTTFHSPAPPFRPPFLRVKTNFAGHFLQSSNLETVEYGNTSPLGND